MFAIRSDDGYREILDKIHLKTLVHGEKTLMADYLGRHCLVVDLDADRRSRRGNRFRGD